MFLMVFEILDLPRRLSIQPTKELSEANFTATSFTPFNKGLSPAVKSLEMTFLFRCN